MFEVRITPLVLKDLEDIWFYTFNEWSLDQANLYQDLLDRGISKIAENPFQGKSLDNLKLGYYKFNVQHHSIFYYIEESSVVIVRILHEMMDTGRHL
jgi:toxin ParE1/3/4